MKAKFTAQGPDEAVQIFGTDFYAASQPATQAELDERVQLAAFLRTYALSPACAFPIDVVILPREQRPDFKVAFGCVEIGIETSKIANPDLEQVRSVQKKNRLGTIEISSLLKKSSPRTFKARLRDCLSRPVFIFPDSSQIQEEDKLWFEQTRSIIQRKKAIRMQPSFHRYSQTWLLLWDKLSYDGELDGRVTRLASWLDQYWQIDFFPRSLSKSSIQNAFSFWLPMVSSPWKSQWHSLLPISKYQTAIL
jgi:hypothetical protein